MPTETMTNRSASRGESGKGRVSQDATDSVALGDVIYIKLRNGTWWPAQVVDDKSVDETSKPSKRSSKEVLVRLYGSYTFKYADPTKCRSEFEMVLKDNNGSYQKILHEALERALPSTKSRSKVSSLKTKESTSKRKKTLNDDDLGCQGSGSTSFCKSQELSARRIRVMESLGLIAPRGSPFVKDRRNYMQSS